jgi:hypothetical protein
MLVHEKNVGEKANDEIKDGLLCRQTIHQFLSDQFILSHSIASEPTLSYLFASSSPLRLSPSHQLPYATTFYHHSFSLPPSPPSILILLLFVLSNPLLFYRSYSCLCITLFDEAARHFRVEHEEPACQQNAS